MTKEQAIPILAISYYLERERLINLIDTFGIGLTRAQIETRTKLYPNMKLIEICQEAAALELEKQRDGDKKSQS